MVVIDGRCSSVSRSGYSDQYKRESLVENDSRCPNPRDLLFHASYHPVSVAAQKKKEKERIRGKRRAIPI